MNESIDWSRTFGCPIIVHTELGLSGDIALFESLRLLKIILISSLFHQVGAWVRSFLWSVGALSGVNRYFDVSLQKKSCGVTPLSLGSTPLLLNKWSSI